MSTSKKSYTTISRSRGQRLVFLAIFASVIVAMSFIFQYYIWPFLFAIVLYITLKPAHDWLLERIPSRKAATATLLAAFSIFVIAPLLALLFLLANQSLEIYQFVSLRVEPDDIERLIYRNAQVKSFIAALGLKEKAVYQGVITYFQKMSFDVFSGVSGAVNFSINIVVNFIFTLVLLTYFLLEAHKLRPLAYSILPFPPEVDTEIITRVKNVVKIVVFGNVLVMLLQGAFVGVGFLILGLDMWVVAAVAAAIFSLIPVVGTAVAWVPAAAYLALNGETGSAVFITVWGILWYNVFENILKPHLFGKRLNFHPVLFFFLLLGSIRTFNLPGIIIGPVLLSVFYSLWEIYKYLDLYGVQGAQSRQRPRRKVGAVGQ